MLFTFRYGLTYKSAVLLQKLKESNSFDWHLLFLTLHFALFLRFLISAFCHPSSVICLLTSVAWRPSNGMICQRILYKSCNLFCCIFQYIVAAIWKTMYLCLGEDACPFFEKRLIEHEVFFAPADENRYFSKQWQLFLNFRDCIKWAVLRLERNILHKSKSGNAVLFIWGNIGFPDFPGHGIAGIRFADVSRARTMAKCSFCYVCPGDFGCC